MRLKELRQELGSSTNLCAVYSALSPPTPKHCHAFSGILKLVIYLGKSQGWFDFTNTEA